MHCNKIVLSSLSLTKAIAVNFAFYNRFRQDQTLKPKLHLATLVAEMTKSQITPLKKIFSINN